MKLDAHKSAVAKAYGLASDGHNKPALKFSSQGAESLVDFAGLSRGQKIMAIPRGLTALAVVATLAVADPAVGAGPGVAVDVVNTPANPVPVTGSVTGTVELAPDASVLIDNTVADPVRVRSVNDAIQPVQASASCSANPGVLGCAPADFYTVPAGKRLVIEYVSMSTCTLIGGSAQLSITTTVGGGSATHFVNTAPPATGPGTTAFACNFPGASSTTAVGQQVRLYADAGTIVFVEGDRANNSIGQISGVESFAFSISGYLVDVPFTP